MKEKLLKFVVATMIIATCTLIGCQAEKGEMAESMDNSTIEVSKIVEKLTAFVEANESDIQHFKVFNGNLQVVCSSPNSSTHCPHCGINQVCVCRFIFVGAVCGVNELGDLVNRIVSGAPTAQLFVQLFTFTVHGTPCWRVFIVPLGL